MSTPLPVFPQRRPFTTGAFTLIELLVIIGLIAGMMALLAPAVPALKGGGDFTAATYAVSDVLQNARAYATANNTYVWVGIFEEDADANTPGVAGIGRVVLSTVASRDGTALIDPTATGTTMLDPARLVQVGKLVKIPNAHLKTFDAGDGSGSTFTTRPAVSHADATFGDTPTSTFTPFQYPAGTTSAKTYLFNKVIQFSPRGETCVASGTADSQRYTLTPVVEIGLQPSRGSQPETKNPNVAAIQISGILGNVTTYRR